MKLKNAFNDNFFNTTHGKRQISDMVNKSFVRPFKSIKITFSNSFEIK